MAKKEKIDPTLQAEKSSVIYWLLIGFVVVFLFWSPFQKGLFNGNSSSFERPIYSSLIWSSIILFLIAIFFFFVWNWKTHRDALTVVVWLLPISYLISLASAASHFYATNMVYIQIMLATFFVLGIYLARNKFGNRILTIALLGSGYLIVFFGLMNWLGNGKFAGSLVSWFAATENGVYRDAVMTDSNGLRLTSVFQYANSYAAYLIALLFASLFLVAKSRKWYVVGVNAFLLVPIILSFFLTLSRGAYVIIPIILLIVLLFQSIVRQILFLVHMGLAFAASLLILQKITDAGIGLNKQFSSSISTQNWLLLLGVSLATAIISWAIQRFAAPFLETKLDRFKGRKLANFAVPIAAVVLGVVGAILIFADTGIIQILPANVKIRLENINFAQHSVLERGTFYKDAVKLFKDYPIIGAGGGAWSALFEKYQSYPYISRQDHSFFMQYLDEVGLVGTLIFLAFLVYIFYLFIRAYIQRPAESRDSHFIFFIVTISLLIHSIIDFDLSYIFMEILLFLSLGAMVSSAGDAPFKWNWDRPVINKTYPAILLILSITIFFISVRLLSANGSFKESSDVIQKSKDYNQIVTPLNEAIKLHPDHPDYLLPTQGFPGKIGLLLQIYNQDKTKNESFYSEAQTLLTSLDKKEPFNRQLLNEQITAYKLKNQLAEASKLVNENLKDHPWIISLYEESIALNVDLGMQAYTNKNAHDRDQNWNTALETYSKILENMNVLKTFPKEQNLGQPFNITNRIALSIGQIKYSHGDYTAAVNLLKPFVTDKLDDQTNLMVDRWYYAATSKLNTPDQALYDKLLAKDPNEKQQIETLAKTEPVK